MNVGPLQYFITDPVLKETPNIVIVNGSWLLKDRFIKWIELHSAQANSVFKIIQLKISHTNFIKVKFMYNKLIYLQAQRALRDCTSVRTLCHQGAAYFCHLSGPCAFAGLPSLPAWAWTNPPSVRTQFAYSRTFMPTIIQCVSFCAWLLSLRMWILRFIPVLAVAHSKLHSCLEPNNSIPLCLQTPQFWLSICRVMATWVVPSLGLGWIKLM